MSHLDLIRTPKVDNVKLVYHCATNNSKGSHGTLHLTTTHIIFVNLKEGKETWILYGHIAEAEKLPLSARGSSIQLKTTTFLNVTLIITRERDCNDVFDTINHLSKPVRYEDLYAFHYSPKEEDLVRSSGWFLYDALAEFNRMEVPNELWLPSPLNEKYKLCDTYPSKLFLPSSVTNEIVYGCAHFRSKNRLPVLSYYHKSTKAAICRCAQPLAGFNSRCNEDEDMIQCMIKSNPSSNRMYIVDTRPKINAMANRAAGKGYENVDHYENVDYQFIGIENIHAMRSSLRKMIEVFETKDLNMSTYLQGLHEAGWIKHIKSVMDTSSFIAKAINYEKRGVLVHCSDGWDRTAQTCSIASLILDPYYRTIHGFQMLAEKEWLAFGHKFTDRCGMLSVDVKETSPIFTQFLESVWQLMCQYPTAFQFNEQFLVEIHNHLYSHQFGTFIGNSERERYLLQLPERTYSLWGYMWQNLSDFVNPFYLTNHGVLVPLTSQKHFRVWRGLYNKHTSDVHPQESIINSVSALNDNNTSLKCHIRYLEERIQQLGRLSANSSKDQEVVEVFNKIDLLDETDILDSNMMDENESDIRLECLDVSDSSIDYNNSNKLDEGNVTNLTDTNTLDTITDGFEKLESVTELVKDIPPFAMEWESILASATCFCGKQIDSHSRISYCWNCGRKSCNLCINRSAKIPGHYSESSYPVCRMCHKELNR